MRRQESRLFGERLRAERARLDLTQTAFALAVGVGKTSQVGYENGQHVPDIAYLAAAQDVGVDIQFVLTGQVQARRVAELFNWQLMEELLELIDKWARKQAHQPSSAEKAGLIRFFYKQFCHEGDIDELKVADTFELAARRA